MASLADTMRVLRHETADEAWQLYRRAPEPRLRAFAHDYVGYVETAFHPVRRREMPIGGIVVIINLGAAFRLAAPDDPAKTTDHQSFVAGLHDGYTLVQSTGLSCCLQVNFTPLGAYRFLGMPLKALANRVVALDDLPGPDMRVVEERLRGARDWATRFDFLDAFISSRVAKASGPSDTMIWAWRTLDEAAGAIGIGDLCTDIGCSHKHFITRFRDDFGLTPKMAARILRFNRAIGLIDEDETVDWAGIAAACGYFDQSHLVRDFRAFSGGTPGDFVRRRSPGTRSTVD